MKTELVNVSSVIKEVKIEIEAAAIKKVYSQVAQRYLRLAVVPGFRKGNAPLSLVANRFKEEIQSEVMREILPSSVAGALQEHNLNPLAEPDLQIDGDDKNLKLDGSQDLKLKVQVEIFPEVETPTYKGLEAVRRLRPLPEGEVDKVLESLRQEQAFLAPVEDRKADIGDTVTVNIRGEFLDDHNEEPIVVDDLEIELGSENVEKAFTENLVGMEADETKTFMVVYPEDFTSEGLAGKSIEYTATVQSVGKMTLPELDEDFVQTLGEDETKTVEDLRAKVRKDLDAMIILEADNRLRDELVEKMIAAHPIEVPPTLANAQAVQLVNTFANQMAQRGLNPEQADKRLWDMVYERMIPQAENEVRGAMLLDAVAQAENVEVSDEQIDEEIKNISAYMRRPEDEVRKAFTGEDGQMGNLIERLKNRRAVEIIFENATITDGEWIDPEIPGLEDDSEPETDETDIIDISAETPEDTTETSAEETPEAKEKE